MRHHVLGADGLRRLGGQRRGHRGHRRGGGLLRALARGVLLVRGHVHLEQLAGGFLEVVVALRAHEVAVHLDVVAVVVGDIDGARRADRQPGPAAVDEREVDELEVGQLGGVPEARADPDDA